MEVPRDTKRGKPVHRSGSEEKSDSRLSEQQPLHAGETLSKVIQPSELPSKLEMNCIMLDRMQAFAYTRTPFGVPK